MSSFLNKSFFFYVAKFAVAFCILYFGTLAIIGLSAPEGYYSPFVAHYINFIDWLRMSLLYTSRALLSAFNYTAYIQDKYILKLADGSGIKMVYKCIGYGVMSFWGAFIIANDGTLKKKIKWLAGGWFTIWCINVVRISLLLIVLHKGWKIPFGLDHHTWFNIAAYIFIFVLIYFYDRSSRPQNQNSTTPKKYK